MAKATFYRQHRVDEGERTGISLDHESVLMRFVPGPAGDDDPTLLWFVDVRCDNVPAQTSEQVMAWFRVHSEELSESLLRAAAQADIGIDTGDVPVLFHHNQLVDGATVIIAASASTRLQGREMAHVLRDTAAKLNESIESLEQVEVG